MSSYTPVLKHVQHCNFTVQVLSVIDLITLVNFGFSIGN